MKVPYDEALASHIGSESCGSIREDALEALTGVRAGWVLSLENVYIRSADSFRPLEGNTGRIAIARSARTPRGLRPHARTQAPHKEAKVLRSEAGRSRVRLGFGQVRAVNPKGHDGDARTREVGQAHSTCEVSEQGRWCAIGCGGDGGKGSGQGEAASANQAHGTQRPVPQGGPATRAGAATTGGLPPVRLIHGKSPVR